MASGDAPRNALSADGLDDLRPQLCKELAHARPSEHLQAIGFDEVSLKVAISFI